MHCTGEGTCLAAKPKHMPTKCIIAREDGSLAGTFPFLLTCVFLGGIADRAVCSTGDLVQWAKARIYDK